MKKGEFNLENFPYFDVEKRKELSQILPVFLRCRKGIVLVYRYIYDQLNKLIPEKGRHISNLAISCTMWYLVNSILKYPLVNLTQIAIDYNAKYQNYLNSEVKSSDIILNNITCMLVADRLNYGQDEQHYHKTELERLNKEIEKCTDILKKMYLDQLNKVIDMDLWITIKNEYEIKLNRLNAELQRHQNANIDYLETGMKILDVCHKASLPYSELKPEMIAQLVWQSYSSVTVKAKSVKVKFAEPFATLEKLVRVAKQGIAELGYDEFAKTLENSKTACLKGIKKEPTGSFECVSPSSTCMKWWNFTYGLTLQTLKVA